MWWNRIAESSKVFAAHTSLFCFTLLLLLKLDHIVSYSWRIVFFPLFLFHVVVARSRSSLPGPLGSYGLYVAAFRVPLLIVFELLLYAYLEGAYVSLKIVFLPLLAFEVAIFVDHFRMCKGLLLQEFDEILVALPHFWVAISMGFFLIGDTSSLSWWDVFLLFGLFGRWSTEKGSREEQARNNNNGSSGYNTFSDPPETVKTSPKKDLTDEDDNLCKICFDREKNMVLLPCRHHMLCSICSEKCQECPICRVVIKERLRIYDA